MSYLEPPPMPAPVVVMKDVGGYVNEYQTQTERYRLTDREVRLHECRSACTLALSLPNVCVYPDSTLKFHLAYDPRNHQTNYDVSQALFDSYPPAVRGRLGGLTPQYRILRGAELIALGVRACGAPRDGPPKIIVASAAPARADSRPPQEPPGQGAMFGGLMRKVASVFGVGGGRTEPPRPRVEMARVLPGKPPAAASFAPEAPLPPPRPGDAAPSGAAAAAGGGETETPAPPRKPADMAMTYAYGMARVALPEVIGGAQPILPARFVAYAGLIR